MHHRDRQAILRRQEELLREGVGWLELVLPRALEEGGVHEHHHGVKQGVGGDNLVNPALGCHGNEVVDFPSDGDNLATKRE